MIRSQRLSTSWTDDIEGFENLIDLTLKTDTALVVFMVICQAFRFSGFFLMISPGKCLIIKSVQLQNSLNNH